MCWCLECISNWSLSGNESPHHWLTLGVVARSLAPSCPWTGKLERGLQQNLPQPMPPCRHDTCTTSSIKGLLDMVNTPVGSSDFRNYGIYSMERHEHRTYCQQARACQTERRADTRISIKKLVDDYNAGKLRVNKLDQRMTTF